MAARNVTDLRLSRSQLSGVDSVNVQWDCNLMCSVSLEGYWE
jgi:hypothetical protein